MPRPARRVWETKYNASYSPNPAATRTHGTGPKSTPTFADGRLFTLGMSGIVTAFDAASGKQLWQKPRPAIEPLYHTAMSPLVDGSNVIVHVGGHNSGALTAFDVRTGDVKWSWNGDGPAYGSPIVADARRHAPGDHHDAGQPGRRSPPRPASCCGSGPTPCARPATP